VGSRLLDATQQQELAVYRLMTRDIRWNNRSFRRQAARCFRYLHHDKSLGDLLACC
jgi:hypothetical protein